MERQFLRKVETRSMSQKAPADRAISLHTASADTGIKTQKVRLIRRFSSSRSENSFRKKRA
jgi:hypothetical protein